MFFPFYLEEKFTFDAYCLLLCKDNYVFVNLNQNLNVWNTLNINYCV